MENKILAKIMDHIMGLIAGLILLLCLIFKYLIVGIGKGIATLFMFAVMGLTTANSFDSIIESKDGIF
ncbi:MAG: hypothetical protein J6U54_14150 [Clostridiales bacterium]|nr:hypothetical protein [Clostridiales bacterium]